MFRIQGNELQYPAFKIWKNIVRIQGNELHKNNIVSDLWQMLLNISQLCAATYW